MIVLLSQRCLERCDFLSCYHPNKVTFFVDPLTGERVSRFEGRANMDDPHTFGSLRDLDSPAIGAPKSNSYSVLVPCGKCIGCQIDYSRDWATRMMIELDHNPKAIFLTLTYRDSDLPKAPNGDATLRKRDVQLFIKRLRKAYPRYRIRYYLAGEYGSKTNRPHYHAIVYGLSLSDFPDARVHGYNELRDAYFVSPSLENLWSHGFCLLGGVTRQTCNYVARYVTKKQRKCDDDYVFNGRAPEFNLSSRRPGIGLGDHVISMIQSPLSKFVMSDSKGVYEYTLPKAFFRYAADRHVDVSEMRFQRSEDASQRLLSNLDYFNLDYRSFLKNKEDAFKRRVSVLPQRKDV